VPASPQVNGHTGQDNVQEGNKQNPHQMQLNKPGTQKLAPVNCIYAKLFTDE